jgi:hypothetical protein
VVRRDRSNPVRRAGVALLDAIVGAVILGLALTMIIGLSGQALRSQAMGERIATAATLADEQLSLVLARGPDEYAKSFPIEGACDEPFGEYRFKLTLSAATASEPYVVRCTITWNEPSGSQDVVVETRMATREGTERDPDRRPETPPERVQ